MTTLCLAMAAVIATQSSKLGCLVSEQAMYSRGIVPKERRAEPFFPIQKNQIKSGRMKETTWKSRRISLIYLTSVTQ